jgi:hypothetical protein
MTLKDCEVMLSDGSKVSFKYEADIGRTEAQYTEKVRRFHQIYLNQKIERASRVRIPR